MNATETKQIDVAGFIRNVSAFCWTRKGEHCCKGFPSTSPAAMFRYVAFCYFTGRLNVLVLNNEVKAAAFAWPDFIEHIECKAAENRSQFEWQNVSRGDSIFVSDVIGDRKSVAVMLQSWVEKFPHIITLPVYTYRKDRLVVLNKNVLDRFMKYCEGRNF